MKKYLIFRTDRIGDFITSQIISNSIKQKSNKNQIDFVVSKYNYEYIKNFKSSLESDVLTNLSKKKNLLAYRHYKFWHPMDNIRDRANLLNLWLSGKAPWK